MKVNKEKDRGRGDFGWLKANYSFSFSNYYNPERMGFESLRVINEDFIKPSAGFPTHSHKNMEILTFVIKGKLAHKDSLGNVQYLEPGRIQRMYAGKTISHSEYNGSDSEELNLLQIWVEPNQLNLEAEYREKEFDEDSKEQLLASFDGRDDSIRIYQDLDLYRVNLKESEDWSLDNKKSIYVHVVSGEYLINGSLVSYGDSVELYDDINIETKESGELLVFHFLK